jgi:hypothetical protein
MVLRHSSPSFHPLSDPLHDYDLFFAECEIGSSA